MTIKKLGMTIYKLDMTIKKSGEEISKIMPASVAYFKARF
jgi:hypothetical protein